MAKSWDDPSYKDATLKKGQRRQAPSKVEASIETKPFEPTCSNCGQPIYSRAPVHCRCSIWDVGKRRA